MPRRVLLVIVGLAVLALSCAGGPIPSTVSAGTVLPSQASVEPSESTGVPTLGPTPTALPTLTSGPTRSPETLTWSGLRWSGGVLGASDQTGYAFISDILPWADGYVGVGSFNSTVGGSDSAFFTSRNGLQWTITERAAQVASQESPGPQFLVRVGSGLLAVSDNDGFAPPNLWRSDDGLTWSAVDSPSWRTAWTNGNLLAVASGPAGLVAVGSEGLSVMEPGAPVIAYSRDGASWSRLDLPSTFAHAIFMDVQASTRGFVIVGRDGKPDATPAHGGALGVGRPAAWISTDGRTWTAAQVDGSAVAGGQLSAVAAGAAGFFAEGRADGSGARSGWASTDGTTWRLIGKVGKDLPTATLVAGDGMHLIMFGRESCRTTALMAWVSTDGVNWTSLAFSGSTAIPDAVAGPICEANGIEIWKAGGMSVSDAIVAPNGVLVVGSGDLPQEFWFATSAGS